MFNDTYGKYGASAWSATKFVATSHASVNFGSNPPRRLSQRMSFVQTRISIGWVAVRFSVARSDVQSAYIMKADLYLSDSAGHPVGSSLSHAEIPSASIQSSGWQKFSLTLDEMDTPEHGICLVIWQDGGDEDNYAAWDYVEAGGTDGCSMMVDGVSWIDIDAAHRTVRAASAFDAYEDIIGADPQHRILSPPATLADGGQSGVELLDGEFHNTYLSDTPSPYAYPVPGERVIALRPKDLHLSYVVDSSGSSGWNDRHSLRKSIITGIHQSFVNKFPRNVTYDFVQFGARPLSPLSASIGGKPIGVTVSVDDYDSVSGYDQDGNPLSGDVRAHMGTGIVAYGFKSLTPGNEYLMYGFNTGWSEIRMQTEDASWRPLWASGSPSLSIVPEGPEGDDCTRIVAESGKEAVRYAYGFNTVYPAAYVTADIVSGTSHVDVASNPFLAGNTVRIASASSIEQNKTVDAVEETGIDFTSEILQSIAAVDGAVVEQYIAKPLPGWQNTDAFEMLVVDRNISGSIVFFVQTLNGAHIEWTFTPLSEWNLYTLYFLGDTAEIGIDCVDANGDPLPDGTTVEFYVDKQPTAEMDDKEAVAQKTIPIVYDAPSGATSVRISPQDVGKLSRGSSVDIVDDDRNAYKVADGGAVTYHTTTVSSVSEDGTVGVADALPSAFTTAKHASIVTPSTIIEGAVDVKVSNKLPMVANLVDITPVFVGSSHSPEVLNPLDPPQADPSAGPDDYNTVESMVSRSSIELITKNGWAAVRLCPITEDKFETAETRNALARSMFNLDERDQVRLTAIDDMEKGEMKSGVDDSEYTQEVTPEPVAEPSYYIGTPDFTMNHKVEAVGGFASTTMKSFAKNLSKMLVGAIDPVEYLVRKYQISPVVTTYNESGDKTAIILAGGMDVYFACPVFIRNTVDRTVVFKQCQSTDEDGAVVEYDQTVPGTFATDPYDITITYDVTNRGFPANGFLRVAIYDLRRTVATRTASDDDLDDIDGCGDDASGLGNQNEFSTNDAGDSYTKSLDNMLLATDFISESELIVPVNAGVATVTLPPLDRVALLEIHAAFELDDGYSRVVNKQKVYYRNPLVVTINGTGQKAADGETRYDIGATVLWKGLDPVSDGTIVNFESERTWMSPSVSQTISGVASGVLLGPHDPIPAPIGLAALEDTGRGEFEGISVICSYRGFTTKKEGQVEWVREQAEAGDNFYFYATGYNTNPDSSFNGLKKIWSDGLDYATINADLPASSFRLFPYIDTVADDLIQSSTGVVFSGPGLTAGTRLPRWSSSAPTEGPFEEGGDVPSGWASNRMYSNTFIGRPPYREPNPDDPNPCEGPECAKISIYTKSRKYNLSGTGIESDTVSFLESMVGGGQAPTPKPRLNLVEPFGVTVSIEPVDRSEYQEAEWRSTPDGQSPKSSGFDTYSHPIKRDGKSRYLAVAEVTWRDKVVIPRPNNPLPEVSFDVGTVVFSKEGIAFSRLEDRTVVPLDYDTAKSYHVRTSTDTDHFHEVSVDDNGAGITTSTVSCTKGVIIPDHTHAIDIYASSPVAESFYSFDGSLNSHTHRLKSVAVVGIGPVSDRTASLAVQAVSDYDNGKLLPDGTRVTRRLDNYAFSYPPEAAVPGGDDSGYVLEIIPASNQYVDGKIVPGFQARLSGSEDGYTILFHAYARTQDGDIPIADGTRIFADFGFYEYNEDDAKKESSDGDIVIVGKDDAPRTIAVLKISAFLPGMPEELRAVNKSLVTSGLHWFPSVYSPSVIAAPETDSLIFSETTNSFSEIGPSRLNDAVAAAARRMVSFSESLSSSKKVIVIVSDGAESNSDISYDQAISEVKSVDVEDPVEIVFVKLERTDPYDDLVVKKFTSGLSGFEVRVADVADAAGVPDYVYDTIVSSPSFDLVSGWYSNIVDLGVDKLFDRLRFSTTTPGSSALSFSVRFGNDGLNFGDWIDLGSGSEFDLSAYASVTRYMEYRISFRGDPDSFDSPTVSSIEYEYYEPRRYTVLFQPRPINEGKDGYIGEVIFAHQGTIPETSTVSYGIKHAYEGTTEGYWSAQQPGMQDGFGSIVLSRVNELLVRNDSHSFTAAYGGWTSEYDVAVYRISVESKYGSKVPETSYTFNPETGNVVFGQSQPEGDTFTLTLSMKPVFRIAMDIVNKGPQAASIDYVGTMYRPIDKSHMYDSDRRPVYSALETDLVKLGIEPSSLPLSSVVYANLIGDQSDTIVDIADKDTVYYVLSYSSAGDILVTTLRQNFTVIEKSTVSGVTGVPTSMAFMDGVLYVCVLQGERRIVHRLSDTYESAYYYDIGTEYETSGVIRSKLDVWYTTDGASVFTMTRSFARIGATSLSFECGQKFYVSDGYTFISELGDIIIVFSGSGIANAAYILPERSEGGNVSFVQGRAAMIRKSSISIF